MKLFFLFMRKVHWYFLVSFPLSLALRQQRHTLQSSNDVHTMGQDIGLVTKNASFSQYRFPEQHSDRRDYR